MIPEQPGFIPLSGSVHDLSPTYEQGYHKLGRKSNYPFRSVKCLWKIHSTNHASELK